MRRATGHILLLLAVALTLVGCGSKRGVIPLQKMASLYADMFIADQWLRDHPAARTKADSTLFFDPIFRKHGYNFSDYDRSVSYYVNNPEDFAKILTMASEELKSRSELKREEAVKIAAEIQRKTELIKKAKNFRSDSLLWNQGLLAILRQKSDTFEHADTLAIADTLSLSAPDSLSRAVLDTTLLSPLRHSSPPSPKSKKLKIMN